MSIEVGRAGARARPFRRDVNTHYFRTPKGRQIFSEGQQVHAIFHIELGCVRLEVESPDGERDVVGFLFEGDTFSPGVSRYWVSAHAVTDVLLSCTPLRSLGFEVSADDAEAPDEAAADRTARDVIHRLSSIKHLPANARLVWFLRWLNRRIGHDETRIVELPMTCRDVANFLGVAPETVSRGFAELERQGQLRRISHHRLELAKEKVLAPTE